MGDATPRSSPRRKWPIVVFPSPLFRVFVHPRGRRLMRLPRQRQQIYIRLQEESGPI